jgi:hypothetical protein
MTSDFAREYAAALTEHVRHGGEAGLERAHALGRSALTGGLGVLNVVEQHEHAVQAIAEDQHIDLEQVRTASLPFLLQSLAALDMATRGFVEAAERVSVERAHVDQLHRLADSFVGAHVDHLADVRLRSLVQSVREVVDATGACVEFGGMRACSGVTPAAAEAVVASLLTDDGQDAARAEFPGSSSSGAHWMAVRLNAGKETSSNGRGAVVACRDSEFSAFDAAVLTQFAKLASASLRNALLYESEHDIAVTLQSSLLPQMPLSVGDLGIAARYRPSGAISGVGGDWYDVIALPGHRVGLVIGDVMGHGVSAAAFMGQLSVAVHAYAVDGHEPSALLNRVDYLMASRSDARLATIIYAIVDADGSLCMANAGHPPALLVTRHGDSHFLPPALSPPVGARAELASHRVQLAALPPGSTLVLYTDGLIERRSRPIDLGLEALRSSAAEHAGDSVDELCDAMLDTLVEQSPPDDVCILAVRTPMP